MITRNTLAALGAAAALAASIGCAPEIEGAPDGAGYTTARAVDGDTFETYDGQRHRLHGIDAPELEQRCARADGGEWPCGVEAMLRAAELAAGGVRCEAAGDGVDRYGRQISRCYDARGRDIGRELVREGLAWAYLGYSEDYVAEEAEARAEARGVWQGETLPPWAWRAAALSGRGQR